MSSVSLLPVPVLRALERAERTGDRLAALEAWELSVRLAVAATTAMTVPVRTFPEWVAAMTFREAWLEDPRLVELEHLLGKKTTTISPEELLPVIARATPARVDAPLLAALLEKAWDAGFFWAPGSELVHVGHVQDGRGWTTRLSGVIVAEGSRPAPHSGCFLRYGDSLQRLRFVTFNETTDTVQVGLFLVGVPSSEPVDPRTLRLPLRRRISFAWDDLMKSPGRLLGCLAPFAVAFAFAVASDFTKKGTRELTVEAALPERLVKNSLGLELRRRGGSAVGTSRVPIEAIRKWKQDRVSPRLSRAEALEFLKWLSGLDHVRYRLPQAHEAHEGEWHETLVAEGWLSVRLATDDLFPSETWQHEGR